MSIPKFILKNPITIETPTGVISIVDSNPFGSQAFFLKSDNINNGNKKISFEANVRIDTPQEIKYFKSGGILQYVLKQIAA